MFATRRTRISKLPATTTAEVENKLDSNNTTYSLFELADSLVKSTLDLALQASRNLAVRTDAAKELVLDAEALARVAPELATLSAASISQLSDRANDVSGLLLTVHQLTAEATNLLSTLGHNTNAGNAVSLDALIATFESIALRSVDAGETLKATLARLDEGLDCAHDAINPMLNLMHQVNAISIK